MKKLLLADILALFKANPASAESSSMAVALILALNSQIVRGGVISSGFAHTKGFQLNRRSRPSGSGSIVRYADDFAILAKKWAAAVMLLAAATLATNAEEVSPFGGGGLAFRDIDVSFEPRIVYAGWKGQALATAGTATDTFAFDLSNGSGGKVDGRFESRLDADRSIAARWTLTPSTNIWVEELGLIARLPVYAYAGGSILADGKEVRLAKDFWQSAQFRGRTSKLAFRNVHGRETFTISFAAPVDVCVSDSRGWNCQWFELSFLLGHRFEAGKAASVGFRLKLPDGCPVELNHPGKYVPAPSDRWRPVTFPSEIVPGSAADFTRFAVSHAPAGRYGYAVVRDGHFEFEKLPGVTQRFYGINVCFGECYPESPEKADRMIAYFAACGYNAIRIHCNDFKVTTDAGAMVPDEALLRKMDSLVAACVRRGLYITTDLCVARGAQVPWREVGVDADGMVGGDYKTMVVLHAASAANLKRFTRNVLCHRNVHTGRRLADEPALSWMALLGEAMLTTRRIPKAGTPAYAVMSGCWKEWLRGKRAGGEFADAPDELPPEVKPTSRVLRTFCAEKEAAFAKDMRRFLREEIGCKALLTNLNIGEPPPEYASFRLECFDYTDTHYYWDHPTELPGGGPFALPAGCGDNSANPLTLPNRGHRTGSMLPGQPLTITEFHYCTPCKFRGFSGMLTAANAAHDGWGGAWRFGWGGRAGVCAPLGDRPLQNWFELGTDPVALAGERVATMLFLRGDLKPGASPFGLGDGIAIDSVDGSIAVTTARTCGGFCPRGQIEAGGLRADVGFDGGCVWVTSLSDKPISSTSRLLLAHLTDGTDTGTVFRDGRRIHIERWGRLPHLLRAGRADVSLAVQNGTWRVYALDATGRRRKEVPAVWRDGRLAFAADVSTRPDDATFMYELVRE